MGLKSGGTPGRLWVELVVILAVFAAGSGLGMAMLKAQRSPEGLSSINCPPNFLARPLMIAAGRGSFFPDIEAVPGLRPFLKRQAATFDPAALPKYIPVSSDSAAEYHVYLTWAVALIWSALGVSWLVLEPFLALGLGLCAVCVYGLFRLGMNRWLSLTGAMLFASSPAVLGQVNSMRDFSKAPFLLGGLFAIGWLVTRREPVRFLWLVVALMGLLAGVGMGFRQDAIILVPASLATIVILSPSVAWRTFRRRIGGALVYLLAFLAAASPMLTRMEGGAQPYHPLAQGYSMKHLARCSLAPGVCEPLACSHDTFVFATIFSYARRMTGNDRLYFGYSSPDDVRFTRDWVFQTALAFPADTIARGYGATLNLLADADAHWASVTYQGGFPETLSAVHRRIAALFRVAGPVIAVMALLAAAAAGLRPGLALLLLTLYFCGYVSLDDEWRHTFHLSFVCFWAAGFLLQQLLYAVGRSIGGAAPWGLWLRRAGVFSVLAVLGLGAPWQAARLWQRHTLETVMRQYASAPRSAVPTTAEPMGDWTLFRMKPEGPAASTSAPLGNIPVLGELLRTFLAPNYWEVRCGLYALHLRGRRAGHHFMARYWGAQEEEYVNDFSQVMRVAGANGDGGESWFFFPAYDILDRSAFEGVAMPQEAAGDFLGLYRVADGAQPVLLPCVTLNDLDSPAGLTARVNVPYDPVQLLTLEDEWAPISLASDRAENLGCMDAAVFYARVANAMKPSGTQEDRIAALYERAGQTQDALRMLKSRVISSGGDLVCCGELVAFLKRRASEVTAPPVWEDLARQSSSHQVWQAYEKSIDQNDVEKHMEVLRRLFQIAPDDVGSATKLQGLLQEKAARLETAGDVPGMTRAYGEAVALNPRNNEPVLLLDKALSKSSPADRRNAWESVWKANPDNPHVATLCGTARVATGDLAGAKEALDTARRLAPGEWYYCVLAADALAAAGAWNDAAADYERALAINPGLDYLHGRLEEARKRAADGAGPSEAGAPPPAP